MACSRKPEAPSWVPCLGVPVLQRDSHPSLGVRRWRSILLAAVGWTGLDWAGRSPACWSASPGVRRRALLCAGTARGWVWVLVGRASWCVGSRCPLGEVLGLNSALVCSSLLKRYSFLLPLAADNPPAGHHQHEPVHGCGGRGEPDRAEILLVHPDAGERALHPGREQGDHQRVSAGPGLSRRKALPSAGRKRRAGRTLLKAGYPG